MKDNQSLSILRIDSSARTTGSVTRKLADEVVRRLTGRYPGARLLQRNLSEGVAFIDDQWVEANFTDIAQRSSEHIEKLSYSDQLVAELKAADSIVLAVPLYNFSIPAVVKAWIDMICRARETFRYSENGPQGLLHGKTVYLVMASGGVPIGSEMDFASDYLKFVLRFIGIEDVRLIYAEGLNANSETSEAAALEMLGQWLPEHVAG